MTAHVIAATLPVVRRELHEGWTVSAAGGPIPEVFQGVLMESSVPATVPGCVHTDLLDADLIPDPYLDNNEALLEWIGLVDWTYRLSFDWQPSGHVRHDLVFDGLDTVAVVRLNGHVILESENQHRSYRVDVREHLIVGANALEVIFHSPVRFANERSAFYGARPRPYPLPYEAIRKNASNFGWDWGIATYTSGIWRPVRLESWSVARIAESRVTGVPQGDGGKVEGIVLIERASNEIGECEVVAEIAGLTQRVLVPAGSDEAAIALEVPDAGLWWPVGYGEQPLYDLKLQVSAASESAIPMDLAERRIGFRSVEWLTTPDEHGTPFTLVINGLPVYVKGVNWIPDDALVTRIDRARYERRLRQAVAANVNLVRVWGGGIYESDDFYELCDELGLLTWQDFLFACAAYPEDEPIRSEIEAEARENIVRLASHPSLVLLTGNNENLWGYEDWGWKTYLDGATWGAYYYHELFPKLVSELAPHVAYSPGSPFSPGGEHPNAEAHGTMHLWEQWNRQDYLTYRDHSPRFVAEFGWQAPPAWSTLRRSVSDEPLTPESPGMIVHQKALDGNVKLTNGLLPHFKVPRDMDRWHWAMQLNQAHAVRFALDYFRSLKPYNMGAVVWQLNDCWPVTSWAAIDYDEHLKPLWFALKHAFAPRVISVQFKGDDLVVVIDNDSATAWDSQLSVRRLSFDGQELSSESVPVVVEPWGSVTVNIGAAVAAPDEAGNEFLVAQMGDNIESRGFWYFAEPRDSQLPAAELKYETVRVPGGTQLQVEAGNLVRDLTLQVDKVDVRAWTEDGLITLLPGERATLFVQHPDDVDSVAFVQLGVVRTANELVV